MASSFSGCLEMLPPLWQRINYGRVDTPTAGDPVYRRWLPHASALPDNDDDYPSVMYGDVSRSTDPDIDHAVDQARGFMTSQLDYFGMDWGQFEHVLSISLGTIAIEADVERETVSTTLLDSGYEETGTYQEYRLYE